MIQLDVIIFKSMQQVYTKWRISGTSCWVIFEIPKIVFQGKLLWVVASLSVFFLSVIQVCHIRTSSNSCFIVEFLLFLSTVFSVWQRKMDGVLFVQYIRKFSENLYFLPHDTQTHLCTYQGVKWQNFAYLLNNRQESGILFGHDIHVYVLNAEIYTHSSVYFSTECYSPAYPFIQLHKK